MMFRFVPVFAVIISGMAVLTSPAAQAVDLILPPGIEGSQPFYAGAQVKIGDKLIPIREASLPEGQLAAFRPDQDEVIVSNAKKSSDIDKGTALMQVLEAMEAGEIAPAAGTPDGK